MKKNKNKNIHNKKARHKKPVLSKINSIFFCLIIVSGLYYIFGVNDLSIKGFKLYDLKAKLSGLYDARENLEMTVTQLESYDQIASRIEKMNLVKADKIDYVTVMSGVALKN